MPEGKENNALFNRDYLQGLVTEHVAKGLRVTPFLNKAETDADNYVFYTESATAEADVAAGVLDVPMVRAPGSQLDIVRTSALSATSKPVLMAGFRYLVETAKIEAAPYSIERFIKRLGYAIGRTIEADVNTEILAKAAAGTASVNDGVWSTSTKIDEDIIEMQSAFYDDSLPDVLTGLFFDATNFEELKKFIRAQEGNGLGFADAQGFDWLGTRMMYGGSRATHGTAVGFDLNNAPATVVYGSEPGAYNPSVMDGMEGYAPLINVMVKQIDDEMPRRTEIYMAAKYTIAVEEPNALLAQTGL